MDINILAIFVAATAYFLIGMLWYSPWLFGSCCHHEIAKPEEGCKTTCFIKAFIGEFILDLIIAAVLGFFIFISGASTYLEGILLVTWIWVGFIATTHLSGVIWGTKTLKSFFVHSLFVLVGLIAMSSVIIALG